MLRFITIAIMSAAFIGAEEAPSEASNPAIDKAIIPAYNEASKAYKSYQIALLKANDSAIKNLEKVKSDAMKKNDLKTAVAVENRIKELKEGWLDKLVVEESKKGLLGDSDISLTKVVIGKWKMFSGTFTIDQKLRVLHSGGGTGVATIKSNMLTIEWSNGYKLSDMIYDGDKKQCTGKHINSHGIVEGDISITKVDQ